MKPKRLIHRFGPYEFDPVQQQLRNGALCSTLPTALNKLLLLFVSRPGELITRDEIARTMWERQETVDTAAGINTAIRRLRTQIGDNNGHGAFIQTVVGAGYRFVQPVSAVTLFPESKADSEIPPDAEFEARMPPSLEVRPVSRRFRRKWPYFVAVGALTLLAGVARWREGAGLRSPWQKGTLAGMLLIQGFHPVTFDEPEDSLTAAAISPSGRYLATSDEQGISIQTLSTSGRRIIHLPTKFNIARLSWFPDESALLASGAGVEDTLASQTWRISLNSAEADPQPTLWMQDAGLAAVSPDGQHVAYVRAGQKELWVAGPNGESPRKLVQASEGDTFSCLLWSPRSNWIVTDHFHAGMPTLAGADLSPGGDATRPQNGSPLSYVYETYDTNSGALLARRENVHFDSAILFQDGTLLYPANAPPLTATLSTVETDPATGAFLSSPRSLSLEQAATEIDPSHTIEQISKSADGQTISAIVDRPAVSVYTADLASSPGHAAELEHVGRLSRQGYDDYPTAWSPDGRSVIFSDGPGMPTSIVAEALDGSSRRVYAQVNTLHDRVAQGHFSSDGRWLLYMRLSKDNGRVLAIERVPAQGGAPDNVPTRGQVEEFRCSDSAAGRCVLREVEGKSQLHYYVLDPVSGMGAELARTTWQPNVLGDWSLSPDGSTVAMTNHDPAHPAIQLLDLPTVPPAKTALSTLREIPVQGFGTLLGAHWAVDSRGLFVGSVTTNGRDLLLVGLDGRATLLRQSPALIWAVPSLDGKKIAFPAMTASNRNVWVGAVHLGNSH